MTKELKHNNSVEMAALFLAGRIESEDLSEPNQELIDTQLKIIESDPEFASEINKRKNQLLSRGGRITPLFNEEQIERMTKQRIRREPRNCQTANQMDFLEAIGKGRVSSIRDEDVFDPERRIHEQGRIYDRRYGSKQKNTPVREEIEWRKGELRERIRLPAARGDSPYVNDTTYKLLVKKVYMGDEFGIFMEYDRVIGEESSELVSRIEEVREIVSNILGSGFGLRKIKTTLNQDLSEYRKRWNISDE